MNTCYIVTDWDNERRNDVCFDSEIEAKKYVIKKTLYYLERFINNNQVLIDYYSSEDIINLNEFLDLVINNKYNDAFDFYDMRGGLRHYTPKYTVIKVKIENVVDIEDTEKINYYKNVLAKIIKLMVFK